MGGAEKYKPSLLGTLGLNVEWYILCAGQYFIVLYSLLGAVRCAHASHCHFWLSASLHGATRGRPLSSAKQKAACLSCLVSVEAHDEKEGKMTKVEHFNPVKAHSENREEQREFRVAIPPQELCLATNYVHNPKFRKVASELINLTPFLVLIANTNTNQHAGKHGNREESVTRRVGSKGHVTRRVCVMCGG